MTFTSTLTEIENAAKEDVVAFNTLTDRNSNTAITWQEGDLAIVGTGGTTTTYAYDGTSGVTGPTDADDWLEIGNTGGGGDLTGANNFGNDWNVQSAAATSGASTTVFTGYETSGFASASSTSLSLRLDDDNVPAVIADLMVNDVLVFVNNGVTPTGTETQYTIQSLTNYSGAGDDNFNISFTPGLSSSASFRSDVYRIETSGGTATSLNISNDSSNVLTATPAGVNVAGNLTVNGSALVGGVPGVIQFLPNLATSVSSPTVITHPNPGTPVRIKVFLFNDGLSAISPIEFTASTASNIQSGSVVPSVYLDWSVTGGTQSVTDVTQGSPGASHGIGTWDNSSSEFKIRFFNQTSSTTLYRWFADGTAGNANTGMWSITERPVELDLVTTGNLEFYLNGSSLDIVPRSYYYFIT